jgi:hypothetical protein
MSITSLDFFIFISSFTYLKLKFAIEILKIVSVACVSSAILVSILSVNLTNDK